MDQGRPGKSEVRGQGPGFARKIDDEQIEAMTRLRGESCSLRAIGKIFSVSGTTGHRRLQEAGYSESLESH